MLIASTIAFGFYIVFMYPDTNIRAAGGTVEVKKINGTGLGDKFLYA